MRTTFNLDDELLGEAQRLTGLTGLTERTAVVHEGLRALIERERARRLARLGGTEPGLRPAAGVAAALGEPLLFKGDDFPQTDVAAAAY